MTATSWALTLLLVGCGSAPAAAPRPGPASAPESRLPRAESLSRPRETLGRFETVQCDRRGDPATGDRACRIARWHEHPLSLCARRHDQRPTLPAASARRPQRMRRDLPGGLPPLARVFCGSSRRLTGKRRGPAFTSRSTLDPAGGPIRARSRRLYPSCARGGRRRAPRLPLLPASTKWTSASGTVTRSVRNSPRRTALRTPRRSDEGHSNWSALVGAYRQAVTIRPVRRSMQTTQSDRNRGVPARFADDRDDRGDGHPFAPRSRIDGTDS